MNLNKFVIILGVLAIFLFGFLITLVILDPIIWLAVYEKTELKSGTPSFQQWMDPTIDIFFEAYFFNLTNPDEFLSGKKPIVQQVGPYTYRERRFKTEVKRSLYPTMFTYKEVKQYFFDLDRSAGPETDPITTVSMGYLGVDVKFGWLPELVTKVVEFLENRTGEHLIITRSVHELMWGYEDPFLALLKKAFIPVPNTMVGLYLDKNNTDDGIITIYGDNKDKQNYGHIYKYHGSTHLSCWKSDQANQINGSDGSLFHPFMSPTEDPYIFSADICRSLQLHAVGMTRLRGVPVMRYLPYTDTFTSPLKEEKNRGFCINWPDCMADNMFDVSTCIPGAPIAMSLPHFQNSFNAVLNEMRADKETKADLHCRADDLRDQLYEILDESKLANEARIPVCLNPSSWLTNKLYLLTNYYVALMQVELARFEERASLVRDYYRLMEKQTSLSEQTELERIQNCIDPRATEYTRLPLLQLTEDSFDVEEADSTKSKASTPSLPTGRKKITTSSHSKSRESSSGNRPPVNTLSDYSSSLDSVISCLPPEFATRTILLNSKSNLAEIYSAITKNGPTFTAAATSGGLQEPNANIPEPRNSARVEGRTTRADRKTSRSSAKASLPNANELFIDNAEAPKESETLFLYNVCLCALQTMQNQYNAEKKRLQSVDEAQKHPTEVLDTKRSTKRSPASRMKKQADSKPPTPVSKITEEDHAAVEVRDRIRQEQLAALEKLVSQCVFRLTLIRVQSSAILTELKQSIAETEQTMVDWIGTCTLKEHHAVDALIEFIRKAIEEEQALPEPLMLDGDRFYVQKEQMHEDGTATMETVETRPEETVKSNDLSYFSFEQLTGFLKQFQHSAPNGIIGITSFANILSPIIEKRMQELSGPTSRENIEELTSRIISAYRLTFGPEDERVTSVSVGTKEPQAGKRQTVEDQSLKTDADAFKVFYIDWRRFLLAATHSFDIFNPEAQPNKEMLIRLCERLFELDQTSADNRGPGLIGTKVTRAQFRFAPFPWFPENHTYYEQLHDFIFSIFADPHKIELQNDLEKWGVDVGPNKSEDITGVTSKPKGEIETGDSEKDSSGQDLTHADLSLAQQIDCCPLMLSLALLSSDASLTGIWRCLSVLSMQEVLEYPNLKTCFEGPANLEARDPLIHQAVLEKLLCFGLICAEPTTIADLEELSQVADTVTSYIRQIKDTLRKVFTEVQSLNATSSSDNAVPLSVLLQQPEIIRLLLEAEPRFTLPRMPEPWPTLLRMYARPDSNSTSTVYDSGDENQSLPTNAQNLLQDQ
ncbi:lysosome membrane protein 2 [Clonorchis sinensis]|uniref:Lysosome membrane protein 2 n=1 Tax=Clonorchis sinensis TaxID=79923 RepID=G7YSE3_CLOSI|nr:lysosome membrane protein 2 [Clonorchis sinensis]